MSLPQYILLGFFGLIMLSSCKKEAPEPEISGRFTEYRSCTVIAPPEAVNLDTFYTTYLNCSGIAIVAPSGVPPEALYAADSIISFVLDGLETVRNELMRQGAFHVLYPPGMPINQLPEWRDEPHSFGPGSYLAHHQVSTTTMANILCYPAPHNRSIFDCELLHEFGHNMHVLGLNNVYPAFDGELNAAYQNAMAIGLWHSTYSAVNYKEYFVEGMQIWYGVNTPGGPPEGNGNVNNISTREQLRAYDTTLYNLLEHYLNHREYIPVCFK